MARRELTAIMPNKMAEEFEKLYKKIEGLETEVKKLKKDKNKGGK